MIGVTVPLGFSASGIAAGIKPGGRVDCAAVVSDLPATVAAVFTTNRVKAAPVLVSIEHARNRTARAAILTSGNANAATGPAGIAVARAMCEAAAHEIEQCDPTDVLIAQTGLIGIPLDRAIAVAAAAEAASTADVDGGARAAEAIMTTDTLAKTASATIELDGTVGRIGGMAKGAGMLAPSMATMLATITTDLAIAPSALDRMVAEAVDDSFHRLVIDAQSTNDTVFVMANGASGAAPIEDASDPRYGAVAHALSDVAFELSQAMLHDAEGATKYVAVTVRGARCSSDASSCARGIAGSPLVKCSLAGEDPYWGRVIAECGASSAEFDPNEVTIAYGTYVVCREGAAAPHDEAALAEYMRGGNIEIAVDLGAGDASVTVFGTDLTHAYVDENMGTS